MTQFDAQTRDISKKDTRALRRGGFVPAEVYGHNFDNIHVAVPLKAFLKTLREEGESSIINLRVDSKEIPVLIHDVKWDNIAQVPESIDFYAVRMDEKIEATVSLRFVGEPPAVKEKNGALVKVLHEIEVEALPADLPREVVVDLGVLSDIGASVRIKDLSVSPKVRVLQDPEIVVATVSEAREEEDVPQGPASVEEIEVEEKGKKETEEAGESASSADKPGSQAKKASSSAAPGAKPSA